jgi:cell division transport system permease protein
VFIIIRIFILFRWSHKDLQALPVVDKVYYESQSEAFSHFQERFKGSAIAQNVTADQLPESFRVKLKDPTQFGVVVSAFTGRPGVDVVQDQRTILEKFFKLLGVLRDGALAVGLASVLTAALLISNTLRIAAFNRRRETNVMKLVGATSWSIQLPFLLEGIFSAFVGWMLATGLLAGIKSVIDSKVAPLLTFTKFFGWGQVWIASGWLLLTGLVVSILASTLTLRKYLKV